MTTTAGKPVIAAAVPVPAPARPDVVLAGYPHVLGCPACRLYTLEWGEVADTPDVVTAVLAYHESSHTFDPLTSATQHFAVPPDASAPD